jgi:hypothetical protein
MGEVNIKEANERGIRVFVGGCVARGDGSSFRAMAHAHTSPKDPHKNWICVRSPKRLFTPSGQPSRLLWEEIAHCLVHHCHYHDATFIRKMIELGQPISKEWRKRLNHSRAMSRKNYRRRKRKLNKPSPTS